MSISNKFTAIAAIVSNMGNLVSLDDICLFGTHVLVAITEPNVHFQHWRDVMSLTEGRDLEFNVD